MIPTGGALCFIGLYIIASLYYPGGSQWNKDAIGFSWMDNYWCNLLNKKALNGRFNGARPIALIAMTVLCVSLAVFWWTFPIVFQFAKPGKWLVQGSGILAMSIGILLITEFEHDLITNLASIFGLIAVAGVMYGLYKKQWTVLFAFGLLNILLVICNNFLYYNKELISYLPLVQKISFGAFLVWICCIDVKIFKMSVS